LGSRTSFWAPETWGISNGPLNWRQHWCIKVGGQKQLTPSFTSRSRGGNSFFATGRLNTECNSSGEVIIFSNMCHGTHKKGFSAQGHILIIKGGKCAGPNFTPVLIPPWFPGDITTAVLTHFYYPRVYRGETPHSSRGATMDNSAAWFQHTSQRDTSFGVARMFLCRTKKRGSSLP